jgi:probable F420-dependent oxidoreductase
VTDVGVVFPVTEIGDDPAVVRDYAVALEELGCSHFLTFDHVLGASQLHRDPPLRFHYDEHTPFHELFVLFGFLAAVTSRVELAAGVLVLPQRQTALVAKQATEVDLLSNGRLRLGIGVGWNYVEFEGLGQPYEGRGARMEEQVHVLRRLWSEELVEFRGAFHDLDRAAICPRPERQIPLWFGGNSEPAYRRAARIGDGFILGLGYEHSASGVERLRANLAAVGRNPEDFPIEAIVFYTPGDDACFRETEAWQRLGVAKVSVLTSLLGLEGADAHVDAFANYRKGISDPAGAHRQDL